MTTRTVRVTRTWDVEVDAAYGDTYQSLTEKVAEEYLDATTPDADSRVVLEEHASTVDKYRDLPGNEGLREIDKVKRGWVAQFKADLTALNAPTEEENV